MNLNKWFTEEIKKKKKKTVGWNSFLGPKRGFITRLFTSKPLGGKCVIGGPLTSLDETLPWVTCRPAWAQTQNTNNDDHGPLVSDEDGERELTVVGDSSSVPNLAKEDASLFMDCLHNGFPSFHLLFGPNSRYIWIPGNWIYLRNLTRRRNIYRVASRPWTGANIC